jgi:tetratricopeptide (TPR) repeat protein
MFAAIVLVGLGAGFNVDGLAALVPIGVGVTGYGMAYGLVHDVYIHGRLGWFGGRRVTLLDRDNKVVARLGADVERITGEGGRAIRGNPEDVLAHCWYSFLLGSIGRHSTALEMAERALALDPLSPYANSCLGLALFTQGRNDEAIAALGRALEMDADFLYTLWVLGGAYSASARHDEAVSVLERAVTLSGRAAYYLSWLAHVCGRAGRRGQAESLVEELTERSRTTYVSPTFFAWACAGLGDTAAALDWVETACEEQSPPLVMHQETLLSGLRDEPRFRAVRARMGLDR